MVLTQRKAAEQEADKKKEFPYHYGSHATPWLLFAKALRRDVSIPLWFLRNKSWALTRPWAQYPFPYHYGSYATGTIRLNAQTAQVSIPLWFLRNSEQKLQRERQIFVSIPLWFLRNACKLVRYRSWQEAFPYHYGSYATHSFPIILYQTL